jgi:ubiquinone/menaquinone biosynthesis C-methylase UbiE
MLPVVVALVLLPWRTGEVFPASQPGRRRRGRRVRPVRAFLSVLSRLAPNAKPAVQKALIGAAYHLMSKWNRDRNNLFMNYGYAPLDDANPDPVPPIDDANRYGAQLYYRVAAAIDLRDKDVLEVGCGRGGGAWLAKRYLQPRSVTGVDLAEAAIKFCRRRYAEDGLSFRQADAENLPFPADAFDVVVNVESSHCYPSVDRFFGEVERVLRPGGYFLFADLRPRQDFDRIRQQLQRAGLMVLEQEEITANVLRALELDSDRRRLVIERRIPAFLHKLSYEFLGVQGSLIYEALRSAEHEYSRFVLRKPEGE